MDNHNLKDKFKKRFIDAWGTLYQNIVTLFVTLTILPNIKKFLFNHLDKKWSNGISLFLTVLISAGIAFGIIVIWDYFRTKIFNRGKVKLSFFDELECSNSSKIIDEFSYDTSRPNNPMDKLYFSVRYKLDGDLVYFLFKRLKLGVSLVFDPDILQLDVDGVKSAAVKVSDNHRRLFIPLIENNILHNSEEQSISSLELSFKPGSITRDYAFLVARIETNIRYLRWFNRLFNAILSDVVIGNERNFKIRFV